MFHINKWCWMIFYYVDMCFIDFWGQDRKGCCWFLFIQSCQPIDQPVYGMLELDWLTRLCYQSVYIRLWYLRSGTLSLWYPTSMIIDQSSESMMMTSFGWSVNRLISSRGEYIVAIIYNQQILLYPGSQSLSNRLSIENLLNKPRLYL